MLHLKHWAELPRRTIREVLTEVPVITTLPGPSTIYALRLVFDDSFVEIRNTSAPFGVELSYNDKQRGEREFETNSLLGQTIIRVQVSYQGQSKPYGEEVGFPVIVELDSGLKFDIESEDGSTLYLFETSGTDNLS